MKLIALGEMSRCCKCSETFSRSSSIAHLSWQEQKQSSLHCPKCFHRFRVNFIESTLSHLLGGQTQWNSSYARFRKICCRFRHSSGYPLQVVGGTLCRIRCRSAWFVAGAAGPPFPFVVGVHSDGRKSAVKPLLFLPSHLTRRSRAVPLPIGGTHSFAGRTDLFKTVAPKLGVLQELHQLCGGAPDEIQLYCHHMYRSVEDGSSPRM